MWRERVAWLRRMPTHYRVLFGGQFLFMAWALNRRSKHVLEYEKKQKESSMETFSGSSDETRGPPIQPLGNPKDPRQTYHELMATKGKPNKE